MNNRKQKPPLIANLIAKLILPKNDNSYLSGDFKEIYFHIFETEGHFAAWRWYWWQIISSIPHFISDSIIWRIGMFKSNMKIALRNLKKYKVYSFINITGLTIGILCSLFILLSIHYEFSYDRHYKNAKNIYRIISQWPLEFMNTNKITWTSARLAPLLQSHFPEIEYAVRVDDVPGGISLSYGNRVFTEETFYFVEPDFLNMFSIQLLTGFPKTVLKHPLSVIISEKAANKYFANENPLGKTIRYNNKFDFQVTGIFKNVPKNTHFQYDFLASFLSLHTLHGENAIYIDRWTSLDYQTYIQLNDKTDPTVFQKTMEKYILENTPQKDYHYFLQPLTKIHLSGNIPGELSTNSHVKYIYIFSAIAALIIIITCFNYINLSTARYSIRVGEIQIRKVVGANRKQLMQQFIGETLLTTWIAFLFALLFLFFTLPYFNSIIGAKVEFALLKKLNILLSVIALVFFISFFSAYYPALHLTSRKSVQNKNSGQFMRIGKSGFSRNLLVIIQFVISTILIIATIAIHQQVGFIMEKNLSLLNDSVLTLSVNRDNEELQEKFDIFKSELKKEPSIKEVSLSSFLPTNIRSGDWAIWEDQKEGEKLLFHNLQTDYDFFNLYNIPIVQGRNFSQEFPSDINQAYIVNETAVRLMNMENPIGKRFGYRRREGIIIGVVQDFHFVPIHQRIKPLAIRLDTRRVRYISAKIDSRHISQMIKHIEDKWKEISPDFALTYSFFDDNVKALYQSEKRLSSEMTLFTYIALFLASLGLFGLALFSVQRRIKEIGVRKVLGAKTSNIVTLLSIDFLKWILVANLIALPFAYYGIEQWMQSFAYRTNIGIGVFIVSVMLSFITAGLTILYQTVKAATTNPVNSIKYE